MSHISFHKIEGFNSNKMFQCMEVVYVWNCLTFYLAAILVTPSCQRVAKNWFMRSWNRKYKQRCLGAGIPGLISELSHGFKFGFKFKILLIYQINKSVYKIKLLFNRMEISARVGFEFMQRKLCSLSHWPSYPRIMDSYYFKTSIRLYLDKRAWGQFQNI